MQKLLTLGCVVASLFAQPRGIAYAAPALRSDPSVYIGKDYSNDPLGALESIRSGTPGHMGGQLPRAQDNKIEEPGNEPKTPITRNHRKCC